jgi:hypothetical protein
VTWAEDKPWDGKLDLDVPVSAVQVAVCASVAPDYRPD